MSLQRTDNIKVLSEKLGFLKITNKASSEMNEWSDEEISVALASATINNNVQAVTPKSMVSDPGWFDRDWTKFEDW